MLSTNLNDFICISKNTVKHRCPHHVPVDFFQLVPAVKKNLSYSQVERFSSLTGEMMVQMIDIMALYPTLQMVGGNVGVISYNLWQFCYFHPTWTL